MFDAHGTVVFCKPQLSCQPQPRPQPEELADIEGAVAAGWREYDAGDGKLVYVNDKTYEEAPKLEKVQKLMDRARWDPNSACSN